MAKLRPSPLAKSIRRYLIIGTIVTIALVGGIGGWAAFAKISSAIVASGLVVVESNTKRVQHREGGIVGKINVKNGDRVKAGELLIRLDETLVRANMEIIVSQLSETEARLSRLEAERDLKDTVTFPKHLTENVTDPDVIKAVSGEDTLFQARQKTLKGEIDQLRERAEQHKEQIDGLTAQSASKANEIKLIREELVGLLKLQKKGLVSNTRITALNRDIARLTGEEGALVSQIAVTKGQISEIELKILQVERDFRETVLKELQEVQARIAELRERKIAASDQLKRIDIRAPISGFIHEMIVHTVGGVVQAGETVLQIVPEGDALVIEARVSPNDIDQLRPGQEAIITFSAFNQRTTPQLHGKVKQISPDLSQDEQTGAFYFNARLELNDGEAERLGDLYLVPGMPAEVFITTGDRTVISYLVKPLTDQLRRTFREQ